MIGSAHKRREFTGPVFYSHGFRSFFLFAGIWAALAMLIWVIFLAFGTDIPSRMAGVDWHMHEMVFGYGSAVIAGFLLTAVPNWTGRLPIIGWPTALLSGLWVLGRVAIFFSEFLPQIVAPVIDSSFLVVLALVIGREVTAGKNWRNLKILIILITLGGANILFHYEALNGFAYQGYGVRAGVAIIILLISIIGGRVIPSFTRNWLVKQGKTKLPQPFNGFDRAVLVLSAIVLAVWVLVPENALLPFGMGIAGVLHLARLWRWGGWQTFGEPLVVILHLGYSFIPLGFFMLAFGNLLDGWSGPEQIPHAWMVGAIGVVTLAMMTRASLGHSGRPLKSNWKITTIYGLIILASATRVGAELLPSSTSLLHFSATAWIVGFAGFVLVYFPIFTKPRLMPK